MLIIPGTIPTQVLHAHLLGAVAPRPICFASTIDKDGHSNLSPFSFFNVFGSNPTTLIFSPARRVRDNTNKHTLENILETREVVINVVTYAMVQQVNLSSCEYERGVDEFEKSGFTKEPSVKVAPFRVKESPVQMECIVRDIIETGKEGGAGNLIICEVVAMHISDDVLDTATQRIDPHKIDLVARMGGDYYCRASGPAVFTVPKPSASNGIGIDQLPEEIKHSRILTGNHLGLLANIASVPAVDPAFEDEKLRHIMQYFSINPADMETELHQYAATLLDNGKTEAAWQVLLAGTAGQ